MFTIKDNQKGSILPLMAAIVVIAAVILGIYYFNSVPSQENEEREKENDSMMNRDPMEESNETTIIDNGKIEYSGTVLAGNSSPLLEFNKSDYDKALQTDKLVVLYFYANWCPICKEEVASALYPAFNELKDNQIVGFQINYNDNQTDPDERNLAREFGIAYQHSKVFLKNGERVLKSPESWTKERYFKEINSHK